MAATINDNDKILQAASVRLNIVDTNFITLTPSASSFSVNLGVATPTSITITANTFGRLTGIPTFSLLSGASTISQTTVGGKAVATLLYSNLIADSATIQASLTYLGNTYTAAITIGGQYVKPNVPSGVATSPLGTFVKISWNKNTDADLAGYEVRSTDAGWGTDNAYLFRGAVNSCTVTPGALNTATTWYVRAYDTSGFYSATSATASYTVVAPTDSTAITTVFAGTSLTNSSVTLTWPAVLPVFGLSVYRISYGSFVYDTKATTLTLPADWTGGTSRTFTLKVIDGLGNISTGISQSVSKQLPNPVTNLATQVIDNNVLITWSLPTLTSLPIDHIQLRKGATWATATIIGDKSGGFTTIQEIAAATYTYWVATVDTDSNFSTPVSITTKVNKPPDYVFNAAFTSNFVTDTIATSNAALTGVGTFVMPVSTSETWSSHFTTNTWTTPQNQVSAGYTIYAQPGTSTGYIEQVFDCGNVISSSTVNITLLANITGSINTVVSVSTSTDNISYPTTQLGTSLYLSNFRYLKIRITATQVTAGSLYELTSFGVRVETKLKTDANMVTAASTDTSGTIVNTLSEFFNILSISVTPQATATRTAMYDFNGVVINSTYSVVSNVCTITTSSAHGLIAGQNVRVAASTGTLPIAVYTILSVTTNTITFNITLANTSGNCTTYPNSFRVYLFDSTPSRQSGVVSWTVRGS